VHGFGAELRKAPYIKGLLVAGQKLTNPNKPIKINALRFQLKVAWIKQRRKLSLDRAANIAVHNSREPGWIHSTSRPAVVTIVKRD
jgi:hypothetical protein